MSTKRDRSIEVHEILGVLKATYTVEQLEAIGGGNWIEGWKRVQEFWITGEQTDSLSVMLGVRAPYTKLFLEEPKNLLRTPSGREFDTPFNRRARK